MSKPELIIVGAGPTAFGTALYTAREDITTLVLDREVITGGLLAQTAKVENYPGFPDGVTGPDLALAMEQQAKRFGAEVRTGIEAQGLSSADGFVTLHTSAGEMSTRAVMIATGNHYRKLEVPGEQEYYGKGVHYCATCDGPLYRDRKLVVVGGGNSAMQEGLFLTTFSAEVVMLVRGDKLKGSEVLIEQVKANPKLKVRFQTVVERIDGQALVTGVVVQDPNGKEELVCDGIFIFVGLLPNTGWLETSNVELDERGFVRTDDKFRTSLAGVFAAGDVRSGSTFQIASAVGEGVNAALQIRQYLTHGPR